MHIVAAGLSDVGLQREHNEDSFCILPEFDLFVVADGMGGHKAGDVASRMATHTDRVLLSCHAERRRHLAVPLRPAPVDGGEPPDHRHQAGEQADLRRLAEQPRRARHGHHGRGRAVLQGAQGHVRGPRRRQPLLPDPRGQDPPSSRAITRCSTTTCW